ncbi:MAG: thioredoxin domain-containing protein [Paracoccaceae bacterium]
MKTRPLQTGVIITSGLVALLVMAFFGTEARAGRLSDAASPYLRSHADDGIDWYPWGEAALDRARDEQRLIFLSIGYATCHWCHVQTRTTFADRRVIELLNREFVSILVDREERPDLDHHFAAVMAAATGQSGWPANFVLLPDGTPLFAAGYIAPEPEFGAPGLLAVARSLAAEWRGNRAALLRGGAETAEQIRGMLAAVPVGQGEGREDPRDAAARAWTARFDREYGGFGRSGKFLMPNVLSFLLHHGVAAGDRELLENVYRTLDRMAAGAVRDQLGGAFHRYAVDRFWQVPHFEIMLDQNAALAMLYLEAYQASGRRRYAMVASGILDDLLDRFRLPGGGFATALDADAGGAEGGYYTWTPDEVRAVLGGDAAGPFLDAYLDAGAGLVDGRATLRLRREPGLRGETQAELAASLSRLRDAREARPPPLRDDKVLTSWNALAVSALARAARILKDDRYRRAAVEVAELLAGEAGDGRLVHTLGGDGRGGEVFLDDYAFVIAALIDLYETDFRVGHLDAARSLARDMIARFQPAPGRPFLFTPVDVPGDVPARAILRESDMASGNAVALMALNRLALYGAGGAVGEQANAVGQGLGRFLDAEGASAAGLLRALDYLPATAREIVIVGLPDDPATEALLDEVNRRLLRGAVVALIPPGAPEDNDAWPLLAGRPLLADKPTAYVCRNRICRLPVDTPAELGAQLDAVQREAR